MTDFIRYNQNAICKQCGSTNISKIFHAKGSVTADYSMDYGPVVEAALDYFQRECCDCGYEWVEYATHVTDQELEALVRGRKQRLAKRAKDDRRTDVMLVTTVLLLLVILVMLKASGC